MSEPAWTWCRSRNSCGHTQPTITPEEMSQRRNAAAVRVRARRRINLMLGVYPMGETKLAPLLRAAIKLEAHENHLR